MGPNYLNKLNALLHTTLSTAFVGHYSDKITDFKNQSLEKQRLLNHEIWNFQRDKPQQRMGV